MTSPSAEVPSHRACQHCRSQKVRCLPDESNPDACQRCVRSGRPCVFTPLQKRKQRKRTDTRVAELEREMRVMRAALKQKEDGTRSSSPSNESPRTRPMGLWYQDMMPDAPRTSSAADWDSGSPNTSVASIPENHFTAKPSTVPSLWPQRFPAKPQAIGKDVIDSGLISMATARQLLDIYRHDLFPHYPIVPISATVTAEELRVQKPALFLALLAAAAGKEDPDLSAALDQEVLQSYATRTMVHSEKSLELVQALLVSAVWYNPPSKFGQLKYYEYIHMAATMAMDIGIGTRPAMHRSKHPGRNALTATAFAAPGTRSPDVAAQSETLLNAEPSEPSSLDTTNLTSRRTFLACYVICAGVSVSLRRPNMLRVTSYLRECVDVLDQSSSGIPSDRTIVAWTKLMMIAEEVSSAFCYDDPGSIASITELRTQLMLKDFEKRLSAWYANVPEADLGTGPLSIMYYTMRLYLHEIALHVDHSPEDFRAPYQMGFIYPFPEDDEVPSQVLAESIAECISCSHSLLNTFVGMDARGLRGLPVFTYVRVSFAAFVLAKLCLSAAHRGSCIGKVLDRSSLKVEGILDRTILHVRKVLGEHPCRVPAIFLALLFKLRQWCLNPEVIEGAEAEPVIVPTQKFVTDETLRKSILAGQSSEGPNTVQSTSSQDSSPKQGSVGLSPAFQNDPSQSYDVSMSQPQQTGVPTGFEYNGQSSAPPMGPNAAFSSDGMDLDNQLVQILGDLNAFSEGGLTGLDDWGALPGDLSGIGYMDQSIWQFPPGSNYNPTTS